MDAAAIDYRAVSVAYAGQTVLRAVHLSIPAGSVAAIVGRSGAGKTTLLKLANRLLLPDAGSVLVDGRDTREWDPITLRRRIGYVIQEAGLLPHLSVADNVALVPRLEGWPADRIRRRVNDLLDLVGLPPASFAARLPRDLSGGQRQRVAVARALGVDPPILLMDEPFGALDVLTRAELHGEFARLQSELRKTIVLVTHDLAEAARLGDRIGVLDDGDLVAWDTAAGLAASTHPRVRPFIDAVPTLASAGHAAHHVLG